MSDPLRAAASGPPEKRGTKVGTSDGAASVISHPIIPSAPGEEEKRGHSAFMYISGTFNKEGMPARCHCVLEVSDIGCKKKDLFFF